MKYNTILEYQDAIDVLRKRNLDMIEEAQTIVRSLTNEENDEFSRNKEEILTLKQEMADLEREINDTKNLKNISIDKNMEEKEVSLQRALMESYKNHDKYVTLSKAYTVGAEGEDVVPVDIWDVMKPLIEEKVFGKIGAHIETNLHDNVQIPIFNPGAATWVSETGEASDGSGSFTQVNLSPKRFSCYVPISKQFLIQAVPSAEARIRENIADMAASIIENQIWSYTAASEVQPAGLCYNLAYTTVEDYNDLVNLEADLRQEKYTNMTVVASPHAEADLKSMIRGTNATGMILENGKVDGLDYHVTSILPYKQFVLIDGTQLVVGFWGNTEIQLIEDTYYAKRGQVCIVLNGYADFKLARPNAIKLAKTNPS